jgi:hypothetical protein
MVLQIKTFFTEKNTNKWLKDHQDKDVVDIKPGYGSGFVIIYKEQFL